MSIDTTQGNFIHLASGERFHLNSTTHRPDTLTGAPIDITDIAIGLATKCRFNGQLGQFYSVAQHSYIMSILCEPSLALEALLHDAEEVYWCDVPRPWKVMMPELDIPGKYISNYIWHYFNLRPLTQAIHDLDTRMGHTEAYQLGNKPDWVKPSYIIPEAKPLLFRAWQWKEANTWFLQRFDDLWRERNPIF